MKVKNQKKESVERKPTIKAVDKQSRTIEKNKRANGASNASGNVVKHAESPNNKQKVPEQTKKTEADLAKKLKKKAKQLAQKQKKLLKKKEVEGIPDANSTAPAENNVATDKKKANQDLKKVQGQKAKQGKGQKRNQKADDDTKGPRRKHPDLEASTVFVGNLPINTKRVQVARLFAEFGRVDTIRLRTASGHAIFKHKQRKEAGSLNAYVVFKDAETANNALALNGTEFKGRHLRITPSNTKERPETDAKRTVFVGSLKYSTTEDSLREIFTSCGEIDYVRCLRDESEKGCKGVAYVCFKSPEAVGLALELNETILDDRPISVERFSLQKQGAKKARDAAATVTNTQFGAKRRLTEGKKPKSPTAADPNAKAAKKSKFSGVKVNAIAKQKKKPQKGKAPTSKMLQLAKKIAPNKVSA